MDENTNVNVDVNSADAIFIPSDLPGDRTNYTKYKVGFYRAKVPANCALVRRNRYTGKLTLVSERDADGNIIGGGFHLMPPFFSESIFVPIMDRTIDYPKADYLTADNIYANVDIVLKVRITDPVKYLMYGKHQLSNLNTLTQNLLREYIRSNKYDDLSSGRINLDTFAPRLPGQNGGIPTGAYEDFEERYGISVQSVQLKAIKLPEEMQKLYDNKVEEQKKLEAQRIKLQAERERAEAEARMMDIRAEAEARRAKALAGAPIQGLKENGISAAAIEQNVGVFGAKNSVFIGGGNGQTNDTARGIAAGVVAGNNASKSQNDDVVKESRVDSLIRLIDFAFQSGFVSDNSVSSYNNLKSMLSTNTELIRVVNEFSEVEFEQLKGHILSGNMGGYSLGDSEGRSRTR